MTLTHFPANNGETKNTWSVSRFRSTLFSWRKISSPSKNAFCSRAELSKYFSRSEKKPRLRISRTLPLNSRSWSVNAPKSFALSAWLSICLYSSVSGFMTRNSSSFFCWSFCLSFDSNYEKKILISSDEIEHLDDFSKCVFNVLGYLNLVLHLIQVLSDILKFIYVINLCY